MADDPVTARRRAIARSLGLSLEAFEAELAAHGRVTARPDRATDPRARLTTDPVLCTTDPLPQGSHE